jgi:hypothetical protein
MAMITFPAVIDASCRTRPSYVCGMKPVYRRPVHRLPERAVINTDTLITVPKTALGGRPVGSLDPLARVELDRALRYSLDIVY